MQASDGSGWAWLMGLLRNCAFPHRRRGRALKRDTCHENSSAYVLCLGRVRREPSITPYVPCMYTYMHAHAGPHLRPPSAAAASRPPPARPPADEQQMEATTARHQGKAAPSAETEAAAVVPPRNPQGGPDGLTASSFRACGRTKRKEGVEWER